MKGIYKGIEVEGTPEEFKQLFEIENKSKIELPKRPSEEEMKESSRKIVESILGNMKQDKSSKRWSLADDSFLLKYWIAQKEGVSNKKRRKNNNKVAKSLGRTFQACAQRWKIMRRR